MHGMYIDIYNVSFIGSYNENFVFPLIKKVS